jgi:hypothetical protein
LQISTATAGAGRSYDRWFSLAASGLSLVVVIASVVRIELDYHLMERVQALFLAGLATLFLAIALRNASGAALKLLPFAILAFAGKWGYCNIWLLERDQWRSPRPFAHAIQACVPQGGVVWTDLPLDAATRYYLGREIRPTFLAHNAELGCWVSPEHIAPPSGWRRTRAFVGSPFGPLQVLEGEGPHAVASGVRAGQAQR